MLKSIVAAICMGVVMAMTALGGGTEEGQHIAAPRIVIIDLTEVAGTMPEAAQAEAKVQAEAAALQSEVTNRWEEIRRLSEALEKDGFELSAGDLAQRQKELIAKERELSDYWEKRRTDIVSATSEATDEFSTRLRRAVTNLAGREGWDFVFDSESGRLIYADEAWDRTSALTEAMKAANPQQEP